MRLGRPVYGRSRGPGVLTDVVPDQPPDPLTTVVDVLSRRGVLSVVRLLTAGPASYRSLEHKVGVVGSVLQQRLRDLRQLGVVEVAESGEYRLSAEGRRLLGVLDRLETWSQEWAARTPRSLRPRGSADAAYDEPD